jgi:hypothetical protein
MLHPITMQLMVQDRIDELHADVAGTRRRQRRS